MEEDMMNHRGLHPAKEVLDKSVALMGLLGLLPFIFAIWILVRITSSGPAIFRQQRIGRYGKPFTMYKFRTMVVKHSGKTVTIKGDDRITSIGGFLRKFKLDEIPELWNVLNGSMSLVGPRPDVEGYADRLEGRDRNILLLKPGITSPASLKYINEEEILAKVENPVQYNDHVIYPDKVRINLWYFENWSFWLDVKLIIYTIIRKKDYEV